MAKTKISEFDTNPDNNTDINNINIAEGCAPSGINNAIRQLMSDLKEFQTGAGGDPFNGAVNGTVGATTPNTGAFTTLSASGAFSANGGATLGDASGDALTINSSAVSIPNGLNFDSNTFVIDATNNRVGIGTASPSVALDISSGNGRTTAAWQVSNNGIITSYTANTTGSLISNDSVAPIIFSPNNTERMRIDSSGNVGIGTTSTSGYKLAVSDGTTYSVVHAGGGASYYGAITNNPVLFIQNNTERMRIDSSGNLLVGTSSGTFNRILKDSSGSEVLQVQNSNNNSASSVLQLNTVNLGSTSSWFIRAGDNNAYKFYVYTNGNVVNTNNSYGAISDVKLKENIIDATPKLEQLCQVKVRNYNIIGDSTKQIGVVAQELEEIFPSMIEESPDRDEEGNVLDTVTKQVKYSVFVPMLIKAIQEQQAIITDLKARIETLESK